MTFFSLIFERLLYSAQPVTIKKFTKGTILMSKVTRENIIFNGYTEFLLKIIFNRKTAMYIGVKMM